MIQTQTCLACGGSGKTLSGNTCACGGSGKVTIVVPDPPKPSPRRAKSKANPVSPRSQGQDKWKSNKIETKASRPNKPASVKNPSPIAKRGKWNWKAGIIGFLIGTAVGMNQLGLERNVALVFGGIAGIIFGYFYIQIIVIAIIAFIAYAVLKKP